MLNAKTFWVIWTFKWISRLSDVCDMILNNAFKLIMIIFNALVDSNKILIMKASDFKMSIDTLFFNDLLTDFHSERTLNVCLQSCKFMFSFFSSSTNLTAMILDDSIKIWDLKMILLINVFHIFHECIKSISVHEFVSSVFNWQQLEIDVQVAFAFSYLYMINWKLNLDECLLQDHENFVDQESCDDLILQINICFHSFCSEFNEKFNILDYDLHWVFCDVYDSFNYFILNWHV